MTRATPAPETVTVHIPFRFVKRGGRKELQMPDGASNQQKIDNALVKALARAFRWKRMLESGEFTTIAELAECEDIAPSYMTRVLRLTLLAPAIVEAILENRQNAALQLAGLLEPFPAEWDQQRELFDRRERPIPAVQPTTACDDPAFSQLQLAQSAEVLKPNSRKSDAGLTYVNPMPFAKC